MSGLEVTLPEAPLDTERLAGLVFELASQLHVERARRIALELALERAGVLAAGAGEALAADEDYRRRAGEGLDEAMRRLMRVLAESDDPRAPLRHEAPDTRS
jgi:hypothetical protein